MMNQKQRDIEEWMTDVAKKREPKKKMIFDKKSKMFIPVSPDDPRVDADETLEFTPEESKRFCCSNLIHLLL